MIRIKPKEIELALTINGDLQQLQQIFRLEQMLIASKGSVTSAPSQADHLIYRWHHENTTHS